MTLSDYLSLTGIPFAQFAQRVEADRSLVSRWAGKKCVPSDAYKLRIFTATGGAVTPNDLLPLPKLLPVTQPEPEVSA
jgi:hypothetical protein